MFTVISPTGESVSAKSVKEFAKQYNFPRASAQALFRGQRSRIHGWCSTHQNAKRHRLRFLMKLCHLPTGRECILGQSITGFAKKHDLCMNEVWKLVNGYDGKFVCRGWVTEATRDALLADKHFQNNSTMRTRSPATRWRCHAAPGMGIVENINESGIYPHNQLLTHRR